MQTTEKITGNQLGLLLFTFIGSTIVLTIPGWMVMIAKQNGWISVIPSTSTGLLTLWALITLANRYPGLTIIQYSSKIIGKWLGKCLGVFYIYAWFNAISVMTIQHTFFIKALLLPKSPSIVESLSLLILCGIAVFAGIEVIGRCNEFLTPLLLGSLIPILILAFGEADPVRLKPFLGEGILPVLQGAVIPGGAFMNQVFILGWLLPYLNQPKKARKVALIAFFSLSILVFIIVLLTIMVLGTLTGKLTYSFLSLMQYIGIEGSFERLEAIAVAVWVLGNFVKVSVSLFILCLCVSQLFGIRNYRDIVAPLTLLSIIGSACVFKSGAELQAFLAFIYPSVGFITQTLIPLSLLMIDTIKRKVHHSVH
ncbi:spore germination protein KB [Paenibacillus sp. V4I3]|uniref:GerAB/ArcD/ProY family transporter n=1 Tax=Paenibacillus sp. V4I3 TaxID=3042305 RepID=UPI00277FCF58|nr:endospore germination permease [Paenibacillus sp. V4I3]MDQ0876156.1 spore germination protein KB [Paenibacillus sp. V4I3]